MKTKSTIKKALLAFTIVLSMAACKKDKNEPTPTPPVDVKAIALTDLKALSTGASVKVPDGKKIAGTVISDVSSKNIDSKTVVLQETSTQTGIVITFDAAQTFALGDQLEINVSNQTLAQVNGEVILQNIPAANAKKTGTGTITAKATTVAAILANKAAVDGTLVTIAATELTGGDGKYTGTLTVSDGAGTIKSNVFAGATFENKDYPVSLSSFTGIVRINGTDTRVDIRKTDDVSSGDVIRLMTDDFSTATFADFQIGNTQIPFINDGASLFAHLSNDDFLTKGRKYVYLPIPAPYNLRAQNPNDSKYFSDLKTVTITFSGSKATGDFVPYPEEYPDFKWNFPVFNAATETVGVAIVIRGGNTVNYPIAIANVKDLGVSHTLTVNIPRNIDDIKKALTKANYTGDLQSAADEILLTMNTTGTTIGFQNMSTAVSGSNTTPVILEKVVFGFTK